MSEKQDRLDEKEVRELLKEAEEASTLPWTLTEEADEHVISAPEVAVEIARIPHGEGTIFDARYVFRAVNAVPALCRTVLALTKELEQHRAAIAEAASKPSYADDVRGMTDDLISDINSGVINTREDVSRWLDESSEVIYDADAQKVLDQSKNGDAYYEETGVEKPEATIVAAYALRKDLLEALEERGYDPNRPRPRKTCESCGEEVELDSPDDEDCPECENRLDGHPREEDEDENEDNDEDDELFTGPVDDTDR